MMDLLVVKLYPHSKTHLNGDQYQNDPNLLNSNLKFQDTKIKCQVV